MFKDLIPYTNIHELNLDWIIEKLSNLKEYEDNAKEYSEQAEQFKNETELLKNETESLKDETETFKDQASSSASASNIALANVNAKYDQMSELYDLIEVSASVPVNEPLELTYEDYYMKASDGTLVASTTYHISNVITVPAYRKLIFKARASTSVAVLGITDSEGAWIRTGYFGGGTANTYEYVADTVTYVRLCSNIDTEMNASMSVYDDYSRKMTISVTDGYLSTTGVFHSGSAYETSDPILLFKGETLRGWVTGSTSVSCISEWTNTSSPSFVADLLTGNADVHFFEFTAPYMMRVRLCSRVEQATSAPYVESERFQQIEIIYKNKAPEELRKKPMFRKTVSFVGDSMMHGAIIGPTGTWTQIMINEYQMDGVNLAVNGMQLSNYNVTQSVESIVPTITKDGYIFIEGGANDFNHDVPINAFRTSVQNIIDTILTDHPKTCLVFGTLYKRYTSTNDEGLTEEDYADAMIDVCRANCVKVIDNYHASGIDLHQAYATVYDGGFQYTGTRNYHFNVDAYVRLVSNYIKMAETF